MKLAMVVGLGWLALGCSLIKTSSSGTTPGSNGGPTTSTTTSSGENAPPQSTAPDAMFMPSMTGYRRSEAESLLREKGFTGQLVATGDTTGPHSDESIVCDQPPFGKYAPSVTITIKYCSTYTAPNDGPTIVGLSVDDAKKKAVASGFTGQIEVMELYEYDSSCKEGNVCQVTPIRWYLNQEHRMQLMVNKKITISVPD